MRTEEREPMRRTLYATAIMVLVTITSSARAELAWMGAGTATCAKYAEVYRQSPDSIEDIFFAWAQGFMSGMNSGPLQNNGTSQDLASIPTPEQHRLLQGYCNAHPLASYLDAVFDLYYQFK